MYSENVTQRQIEKFESKTRIKLVRHDIGEVDSRVEGLEKKRAAGEVAKRPPLLNKEDYEFIRNELVLSKMDYLYWARRYCYLILDGGGLGRFTPWGSQSIVLSYMAKWEEEVEQIPKGDPVDGILIALHKARQLGASMLAQSLLMHRACFTPHNRCLVASADDTKTITLFSRSERIYNHLPFWMKPKIKDDVKGLHLVFGELDSSILLQNGKQLSGIAQGDQFEVSHLTECASWPYEEQIEHNVMPTIPQSARALAILESTAQGRGNWWHEFCLKIQRGQSRRWKFIFVPWYAEETKYRARPPVDWVPLKVSELHAKRVEDTSHLYLKRTVILTREQLYWWETTRAEYQQGGKLNLFLTNYCATPEESFQHTTTSPFPTELLEELRSRSSVPSPYEMELVSNS